MTFDDNFRKIGQVDVSEMAVRVREQAEAAWQADTSRQRMFPVHKDTQTLYLVFDDFRNSAPSERRSYDEFRDLIDPAINVIREYYGGTGEMVRCLLVRLRARGIIDLHVDTGYSLSHAHRIHLPVITNSKAFLTVGAEEMHLMPGHLWEINNRRPHSARNLGSDWRVHLIIDWVDAGEG